MADSLSVPVPDTHLSVGRYALPTNAVNMVPSADYSAADPKAVQIPTLGATALILFINITAQSGAGNTLTVNVEAFDPVSQTWFALPFTTAAPNYTAAGAYTLIIDPRIPGVANKVTQSPLPDQVRIRPVGSGTRTTLTYSIGAALAL
jgi:hypothetical protein